MFFEFLPFFTNCFFGQYIEIIVSKVPMFELFLDCYPRYLVITNLVWGGS